MKASLLERLQTAWHSLVDAEQAGLLLRGPLPLWMQDAFEREAARAGTPVGDVIYRALAREANALRFIQRVTGHMRVLEEEGGQ